MRKDRDRDRDRNKDRQHPAENNKTEFLIEGFSVLSEYVRLKPAAIKQVFCKQKEIEKVSKLLKSLAIKIQIIEELNPSKDRPIASRSPIFAFVSISCYGFDRLSSALQKQENPPIILALDHITDPRNLGAIARSAAFFGVKYLLLPKFRQVALTDAAVSTSQGAFAFSELILVPNLSQATEKLKKIGYWVICADSNGEEISKVVNEYDKIVLLLGSEGDGVSELLKKRSDRIVAISSQTQTLDSLNVSVAAGILLHSFASASSRKTA